MPRPPTPPACPSAFGIGGAGLVRLLGNTAFRGALRAHPLRSDQPGVVAAGGLRAGARHPLLDLTHLHSIQQGDLLLRGAECAPVLRLRDNALV